MIEDGKTPLTKTQDLENLGFNIVVHPTAMTYSQAFTKKRLMQTLVQNETTKAYKKHMITFSKFNEFVGLDKINNRDNCYSPEKIKTGYMQ